MSREQSIHVARPGMTDDSTAATPPRRLLLLHRRRRGRLLDRGGDPVALTASARPSSKPLAEQSSRPRFADIGIDRPDLREILCPTHVVRIRVARISCRDIRQPPFVQGNFTALT